MRTIIAMLGCPGAGKGTQANILKEWLGIPQVSTGDILREKIASAQTVAQMNAGGLVNDDLVNYLVTQRVEKEDCAGGFILDGYPRNVPQAACFRKQLRYRDILVTVEIVVDEESLHSRLLSRKRDDDVEPVIRERFRIYREQSFPVIDYLQYLGRHFQVDGAAPVEKVADAIRAGVKQLLTRSAA